MMQQRYGISSFTLKCIAMVSMLIDHMGAILFPQFLWMRIVGRLAFPIYCFLLVEGAVHTSDIRKYQKRLLVFALLSEIPFDMTFNGSFLELLRQNVFFTLLIGLIAIEFLERNREIWYNVATVILACTAAQVLGTDYGGAGVIFIVCFYKLYPYRLGKQVAFVAENALLFLGGIQIYAGIAALPMLLYNGKPGRNIKYFFYIFYPGHLLILFALAQAGIG